jgi:hypothetical protein
VLNFSDINISDTVNMSFQILYNYWQEIRDGNSIPLKSDFNPMKIASILPEIAIMERIDDNKIIYRLAGTELVKRAGVNLTGTNILNNFPTGIRKIINDAYLKSAEIPCAGHHKVIMLYEDSPPNELECLYLPLNDNEGKIRFHIVLMFLTNKKTFKLKNPRKFIGYEIPAICYFDIGFGCLDYETLPEHVANITKPE